MRQTQMNMLITKSARSLQRNQKCDVSIVNLIECPKYTLKCLLDKTLAQIFLNLYIPLTLIINLSPV